MKMNLHACLGSGNCFKPWIALNQSDRPFDLALYDILSAELRSRACLSVNPNGVVPYPDTGKGRLGGESDAMAWYIADGTRLMPRSPDDRAEALRWMVFEQSKLDPFISPADYPAIARWFGAVSATEGFRPLSELGAAESRAA